MRKKNLFIILFCLTLIVIGVLQAESRSYSALADGSEAEIEFFSQSDETVFNPQEGCSYRIKLGTETTGFRLYLEDLNFPTEQPILIATTFQEDLEEVEPPENWTLPVEQVELTVEQGAPGEPSTKYKFVLISFVRNGIYTAKAYKEGEDEPFMHGELAFQDIDFEPPFVGKVYDDGWQVYDDFHFEGNAIVLEFTVDDTKKTIVSSASSGIQKINIYYSIEYDKDTTIEDLELVWSKQLDKHSITQKYSDNFAADKVGFFFFETIDWVGNTDLFPPFEYSEKNTDLYTYLANIERMLKWQGYTNYLKSSLQDAYAYYRSLYSDPSAQEEDKEQAWLLLVEERNRYYNAKVETIVNVKGDIIEGIIAYLDENSYSAALKGDTLTLDLTIENLPKDYSDYAVLSKLQEPDFDKAVKISATLYYNNQPVAPSEPITVFVPISSGYYCIGVVGYNQYTASDYSSLSFDLGDGWITFDHMGVDKGYVLLLASENPKNTEWVWWTVIGVGFAAVVVLAVFLGYKYKKEKKLGIGGPDTPLDKSN